MKQVAQQAMKKGYVRSLRIGNGLLLPIYVFLILIPLYYEATAKIPAQNDLHVSRGALTHKWTGKQGALIGLTFQDGTIHYFTCSSGSFSRSHDCFLDVHALERLAGKPAVVWWFEQPIYPFSTQHRLARLEVDGQEKVSLGTTVKRMQRANKNAPWYAAGLLVFFAGVAMYSESVARKLERGQGSCERRHESAESG